MSRFKLRPYSLKAGFTIVEMLIIAPIVILTIGAFITVIVGMTGEVLATRSANVLAYNIQDALNRIEEDVKLSTTFLEVNKVGLTSPQGYNNDTTIFSNVSADVTKGNMLILNTLATTGNPLSSTSGLVYLDDKPNDCLSTQFSQNNPMTMNVVYFVKNNTLWRRTIAPSNYLTGGGCSIVPWQQPSCTTAGGFCKTQDIRLVDGINASGFEVQYFNTANANASEANSVASDSGASDSERYAALQSATTIGTTISVTKTAAGREISQAGTIRATKLDINASSIAVVTAPTASPVAPTVTASITNPASAVFTWPTVPSATSYTIDYNLNGGAWINGFTNSTTITYIVNALRNDVVNVRVSATNSFGTSAYGTKAITIPPWTSLLMQNNWTDYNGGYATGAYTKTSDGVVVLTGLLKRSGTLVAGEVIGVLPVGYRPASVLIFQTSANANVASRLDVYPDGNIKCVSCDEGWTALDGIKFIPTGSPYTFTALPLSNAWVNYAGAFETAGYTVDGSGRTHVQGLIKSGTVTAGTLMATLPTALLPNQYLILPADNTGIFGQVGIEYRTTPSGIVSRGGTNGYLALNNMFYPSSFAGWTNLTLQNGWVWYGSPFSTAQYTKSADDIVTLKGLIKSGTATGGTVLATLPVGSRPKTRLLFGVVSASVYSRVDILPTGDIVVVVGNNLWIALDAINFIAEQ